MNLPPEKLEQIVVACHDAHVRPVYEGLSDEGLFSLDRTKERMLFYLRLLNDANALKRGARAVDIGAGLSYFAILLHGMGLEATIVDDFKGGGGVENGAGETCEIILNAFTNMGICVVEQELLSQKLPFLDASVDIVTSFHCLEHFHHSPRKLFEEIHRVLRPGGVLLIGVPNSVNLRKRIFVTIGKSNLCSLEEWYYDGQPFRGHVREPTVQELRRLFEINGFSVCTVKGRNFMAGGSLCLNGSPSWLVGLYQLMLAALDVPLRAAPGLCSDIHVLGRK